MQSLFKRAAALPLVFAVGCMADTDTPAEDSDTDAQTASIYGDAPVYAPLLADGSTVASVDVDRYLGTWFEIGTYPIIWQQQCAATTATYSPREEGGLVVRNWCAIGAPDGEPFEFVGKAIPSDDTFARLEVSFFGDFSAPYWVLERDGVEGAEPYRWAIVGGPTDDTLWILARTPTLPDAILDPLLARIVERGYDTDAIVWTAHSDPPPAGAVP